MFDILTLNWFLPKALLGVTVGWAFSILEDYFYRLHERSGVGRQFVFWSLMILTQSIAIGIPTTYLVVLFIASHIKDGMALMVSTYLVSIMAGFVIIDIRDLIRRITKA